MTYPKKNEEEETILPKPPAPPPPPQPKVVLGVPLVPDVHRWHHWWSMRWMIAAAVAESILALWPRMPPEWVAQLPNWLSAALSYFVLFAIPAAVVSRIVQQQK